MKTFDEAFEQVAASKILAENLQMAKDYVSNSQWKRMIIEIADDALTKLMQSKSHREAQARLCAVLQAIFQTGVLTGMEMESYERSQKLEQLKGE